MTTKKIVVAKVPRQDNISEVIEITSVEAFEDLVKAQKGKAEVITVSIIPAPFSQNNYVATKIIEYYHCRLYSDKSIDTARQLVAKYL